MNKYIYMAVAAMATFISCTSENAIEEMKADDKVDVFTATIQGETRTTLGSGSDDSHKKVLWSLDDQISVNGVAYKATSGGQTKAEFEKAGNAVAEKTGSYQAYYPAEMNNGGTISLPASYTYAEGKFNMPMYAQSTTTDLVFQNICGVLAIKVTSAEMAKVTKITVTSDKAISGVSDISVAEGKYAATATGTTDADKTVTLDCGKGVTPTAEGTTFYLPIPVISDAKLYISVSGTLSTSKVNEYNNLIHCQAMNISNVSIARNNIYNIGFKTSLAKFSTADNKKVNFTKGNLYWNGSAFKIETLQYSYLTSYNASHVSHFYWTNRDVFVYAMNNTVWEYLPFYSGTYNGGTVKTTDKFFTSWEYTMSIDGTNGLYPILNIEWDYLLNKRTVNGGTGNGKSYKIGVTVAGNKHCCIIAPDGYIGEIRSSYSKDEWFYAAAADGLVCLPAAGYRSGGSFYITGQRGCYFSATPDGSDTNNAMGFIFGASDLTDESKGDTIWLPYHHNRGCGSSIRLVKTFSKN